VCGAARHPDGRDVEPAGQPAAEAELTRRKEVPENGSYRVHPRCPGEHWFTDQVTNGPPRNVYDAPAVRHRWVFVTFVVVWVLLVAFGTFVVIHNIRNHLSFDLSFWVGLLMVVLIAAMLMRAGHLRRSAARRR